MNIQHETIQKHVRYIKHMSLMSELNALMEIRDKHSVIKDSVHP